MLATWYLHTQLTRYDILLVIPLGSRAVIYCALSCNNGRRHSRNKIVRRLASRARCCHFCDGACDVLFTILPPGSSNTCRPGPMAEPMEKRWMMLFFNPLKPFPGPSLGCQALVWLVSSWLHHNLCWASTTTTHAESPLIEFFICNAAAQRCSLYSISLFQDIHVSQRLEMQNGRNWFWSNTRLKR